MFFLHDPDDFILKLSRRQRTGEIESLNQRAAQFPEQLQLLFGLNGEMDAQLNGDPIDIAFNARYITDVIRNVSDENLCMKFNSNISPCVVVPESGDDFIYLILPVRVFQ